MMFSESDWLGRQSLRARQHLVYYRLDLFALTGIDQAALLIKRRARIAKCKPTRHQMAWELPDAAIGADEILIKSGYSPNGINAASY